MLAILFDMNDLWEEYIYRQLYKNKHKDWVIRSQNSKQFWQLNSNRHFKTIRPDIVIQNTKSGSSVIIDTKWKMPDNNIPADADLKQMFVYNEYWSGDGAILLYPNSIFTEDPVYHAGTFQKRDEVSKTHDCGVMKMAVLDRHNLTLDKTLGQRVNKFLEKKILK